jgi:hypothetical protein
MKNMLSHTHTPSSIRTLSFTHVRYSLMPSFRAKSSTSALMNECAKIGTENATEVPVSPALQCLDPDMLPTVSSNLYTPCPNASDYCVANQLQYFLAWVETSQNVRIDLRLREHVDLVLHEHARNVAALLVDLALPVLDGEEGLAIGRRKGVYDGARAWWR